MISDPGRLEALQKLAALKGPALSIMVALLIAQRPLRADELETFTGYSNQAITSGLRTLSHFQAIVNLGKGTGYQLASLWRQMMLPIQLDNHENHDFGKSYPQVINNQNHENHDFVKNTLHSNHENHDLNPPIGGGGLNHLDPDRENPPPPWRQQDHENHDLPARPAQPYGEITPSSRTAAEITARSGSSEITAVAYWLDVAGVKPDSHNWSKIIALGHKPDYVKAHVLEFLASQSSLTADEFGTGALIYRLCRNWRAPVMRCQKCLHVERDCQCEEARLKRSIPEQYRDIIQR